MSFVTAAMEKGCDRRVLESIWRGLAGWVASRQTARRYEIRLHAVSVFANIMYGV